MSELRSGLVATVAGEDVPLGVESVPLTGVKIDVVARGSASAVTVAQRYVNRETAPVEAVYSFPLEAQAAVYGFEALIGGRRIVGEIMATDEAFDEYDEAIAAGKGAYLLDQDRPNLFTASIGNLLPGQDAVVTLRYVAPLERIGDDVRLKIPTTVAPRYIPAEQLRRMDPAEFDHLNPPCAPGGVPYGLELTVDFVAAGPLTAVECPSHPARVTLGGEAARVDLSGADLQLDQDVVITFTVADLGATTLTAVRDERGDYILQLDARVADEERRDPAEIVFLIDRSGSMAGSSIAQARDALLLALSSLREGDRFNVVGFGSRFEAVFAAPVAYDDTSLETARRVVRAWDADLGGTELLAPLKGILADSPTGLPRRLLVLSDGEVANEEACHRLVAERAAETAVFAIGVGYGASDHLIRGLARAGRGVAEFVHPNERIGPVVLRQLARLTASLLGDARLDWGGLPVDVTAPAQLPPLFPGTRFLVYGRVPAAAFPGDGPVAAALVAVDGDTEVRLGAVADVRNAQPDAAIPRLFAREAIRDLEENRAMGAGVGRGSGQRGRREARVKDAIVALATRYTLMSSETSFVAVEEREEAAAADLPVAELRRIPVALLKDWHGTGGGFRRLAICGFTVVGDDDDIPMGNACDFDAAWEPEALMLAAMPQASDFAPADERLDSALPESLVELVGLQRADGSWRLSAELLGILQVSRQRCDEVVRGLGPDADAAEALVATRLALCALRSAFASYADEWSLAAQKAEGWIRRQHGAVGEKLESLEAWLADRLCE